MFANRPACGISALALAAGLLSPDLGWCQPNEASFAAMSALVRPNDQVVVTTHDQQPLKGHVVSISDTTLRVTAAGIVREFTATDVKRIDRVRTDSLKNGALWGLAAGLGASFLVLPLASDRLELDDADTALIVGLFVVPGAGAALGAAIDASMTTSVPVYEGRRLGVGVSVVPLQGNRTVSLNIRVPF
jgi:hypothetical protein